MVVRASCPSFFFVAFVAFGFGILSVDVCSFGGFGDFSVCALGGFSAWGFSDFGLSFLAFALISFCFGGVASLGA